MKTVILEPALGEFAAAVAYYNGECPGLGFVINSCVALRNFT